jgi:hypothetical protein
MSDIAKVASTGALAGLLAAGSICCLSLRTSCAWAEIDDNSTARLKPAERSHAATDLADRVKAFTKALDLNALQQIQLRKILLERRDTIRKIWSDRSLLPAERVPATRAANERSGDEIRAMLNDEQRKKYNSAPPSGAPDHGDKRSIEQWLDAARPR